MLVQEPELEWEFIDGSIVKTHQHSAGAASKKEQAIGKSVAGSTTKIHMAADAYESCHLPNDQKPIIAIPTMNIKGMIFSRGYAVSPFIACTTSEDKLSIKCVIMAISFYYESSTKALR